MTITDFFKQHNCPRSEQKLLITYLAFLRMKETLSLLPNTEVADRSGSGQ